MQAVGCHKKENIMWIDCAKALAIFAVLADHVKGILYQNETIQYISFYSVAVFFFLSGMTSFYSLKNRREGETLPGWVGRRLVRILVPYLAAVAVYQYVESGLKWNMGAYVLWALNFNLEGQFYFVLIYLQLIAAAPVLYLVTVYAGGRKAWPHGAERPPIRPRLMRSVRFIVNTFLGRFLWAAAAWGLSLTCVKRTFALETYGGGKYLFGGTYLFLFVLGMIAAECDFRLKRKRQALCASVLAVLLFAGSLSFLLTDRFAWDESMFTWTLKVNPPGPTLILYSLALLFLVFSICSLTALSQSRIAACIVGAIAWFGKYTLYIFLYHTLLLDWILPELPGIGQLQGVWKALVYMAAMLGLPAGGKVLYDRLKECLLKAERTARGSGRG